ncbi:hypothetical protein Micbo1qcDRAFT_145377 [Microdochium bolleyi]|uniref:3',5'-bisphosphate nucleotidase n=1 Tax=Microdochium bolleyi TaxID=196109 RepID=A0A136JBU0_9PEZI|nr:hypothetical protein Micbo1qcDRAFT_145377 [Microdochium bolleyi]
MDSPYRDEFELVQAVVRAAAGLSQSLLRSADKGVVAKDDLSPVTVADFAIQGLLCASIHARFPSDGFVGEESADDLRANPALLARVWDLLGTAASSPPPSSDPITLPRNPQHMCDLIDLCGNGTPGEPGAGRVWVFDPIDGTQTFVRGEAYAINTALLVDGEQVLSVIGCPTLPVSSPGPVHNATVDPTNQGLLIFGARGHGVYVTPLLKQGTGAEPQPPPRRLEPHATAATRDTLRSVSCFNLLDSGVEDVHKAVMQSLDIPLPGCDLLGWVPRWVTLALGLANVTVWVYKRRDRHGKVWDHAGAMMLFEELGGKITDVDGRPIDLTAGRKMTGNHGFVAAPAQLHSLVLDTVQDIIRKEGKSHLLATD